MELNDLQGMYNTFLNENELHFGEYPIEKYVVSHSNEIEKLIDNNINKIGISKECADELLTALLNLEDQMQYECPIISSIINVLQKRS